ncbi:transporter [Saccharospirillum sp. MSK14-1]|uniref:AEC family transporter n=1 Tax=Saccharospirillum sp. MSK14-1 TaxID=1897632 RepID=UPI000D3B4597|nr:AEC family transporter [Saccharospirillum sp. MSK14-1]PTY35708.1 transporter [Saccharospirillum sp. MSK14-1]
MIADALGPVFLLILIGALLGRLNFPGADIWPDIERLTYYLAFPALLVHRLALADFSAAGLGHMALVISAALITLSALIGLLSPWLANDGAAATSVFQGGIRFNTYIGLAAASALFGDVGLVWAAMAVGVMIPLINVLCILAFAVAGSQADLSVARVARQLITNPLIVACVLGLSLNVTGIGLPGWSASTLDLIGATALPLGLLAVGVALTPRSLGGDVGAILITSLFKFIALPALILGYGFWFALPTEALNVLLLLAALPTASSAFILARQLGGDTRLMANIITVQSLLGFVSLPLWLWLGSLWLGNF